jgi:hypothetical protein
VVAVEDGLAVGLEVGSPPRAKGDALALAVPEGVAEAVDLGVAVDKDLGVAVAPMVNSSKQRFGVGEGANVGSASCVGTGVATCWGWLVSWNAVNIPTPAIASTMIIIKMIINFLPIFFNTKYHFLCDVPLLRF